MSEGIAKNNEMSPRLRGEISIHIIVDKGGLETINS